ncbi:MAG: amidophosphoribosyltransferase [Lagierella massiliensis]|nr:amidophosphoribosyltransferase [Lagierella massiliensis]
MSGLIGVYSRDEKLNVFPHLYYGLHALQHRGQAEMGISLYKDKKINEIKGKGLISDNITDENVSSISGSRGLAHCKYAFKDDDVNSKTMPLIYDIDGEAMIIIDGKIINEDFEMKELVKTLKDRKPGLSKYVSNLEGAYSVIYMDNDKMIAFRDNYGIKPLSIGKTEEFVVAASETCAIDTIGAKNVHPLRPGEIYMVDKFGEASHFAKEKDHALCLFELVYIARDDSYIDELSVYKARYNMGTTLAKEHPVDADIVIGAPDSGMIAALGYSKESKVPYQKGIVRNRYIGRTFINPSADMRNFNVHLKLSAIRQNVRGKNVILVDDSIVRGTTIKRTVDILKKAGAKSIHIRISSPPVIENENLSIDIPDKSDLIAANYTIEEMEEMLGCDSLRFLSLEGIREACGNRNFYEKYFGGYNPLEQN